jgi:TonB family protein
MKKYLGVAVAALALINFGGALRGQAPAGTLAEGPPLVNAWVPPVYPENLKKENVTGQVTVQFIVDDKGAISAVKAEKSSDARFENAAVESVKQWTFAPGVSNGAPTAMGMKVTLHFELPEPKHGLMPPRESTPRPLPKSEAKPENMPNPEYPADLLARKIGGKAVAAFVVTPEGGVADLEVVGASHPAFVRPLVVAVRAARFTPAMQGDLPVSAQLVYPNEFVPDAVAAIGMTEATPMELNGLSLRLQDGQTQRDLCGRPPEIWSIPDPLYPRAAALAGIAGEAVVNFDVDGRGNVENVVVVSASAPEFGQAVVDALTAGGSFKPAMTDGRTVAVPMQWKHVFKQPEAEPAEGEAAEMRLIRLMKSGQIVEGPKGLDGKLKPLWRVAPAYPKALRGENPSGSANVEFVIDHEGRVRLPWVVNATHEEFGRAALIAASQWVFDAPTRGGKPTDVRVRVPFNFVP